MEIFWPLDVGSCRSSLSSQCHSLAYLPGIEPSDVQICCRAACVEIDDGFRSLNGPETSLLSERASNKCWEVERQFEQSLRKSRSHANCRQSRLEELSLARPLNWIISLARASQRLGVAARSGAERADAGRCGPHREGGVASGAGSSRCGATWLSRVAFCRPADGRIRGSEAQMVRGAGARCR